MPRGLDILLLSFVSLAIYFDLRERRIPNWLTFGVIGVGIGVNSISGSEGFLQSISGVGLASLVLVIPFAVGWLGAGDVKCLVAIAALLGVNSVPRVLFYAAMIGGGLALILLFFHRVRPDFKKFWIELKVMVASSGSILPEPMSHRGLSRFETVPWAVAIGGGALVAYYLDPNGRWAGI